MIKMRKYVLHVGLPKCASTFLRKSIFPRLDDVAVFGDQGIPIKLYNTFYDDKINLITDEMLCGIPIVPIKSTVAKEELFNRLYSLFPHARIIVVFRDKKSWLLSAYKHYIQSGGIETFTNFKNKFVCDEVINFDKCEKLLQKTFDEVLVMKFEDLKNDGHTFVKEICDFIGVPVPDYNSTPQNVSMRDNQIHHYMLYNRLYKTRYNVNGYLSYRYSPLFWYKRISRLKNLLKK